MSVQISIDKLEVYISDNKNKNTHFHIIFSPAFQWVTLQLYSKSRQKLQQKKSLNRAHIYLIKMVILNQISQLNMYHN